MPAELLAFQVTPTVDTSAYANNDLLFDTVTITTKIRELGRTGYIAAVEINDKDDEGSALSLVFMHTSNSAGSINSAPTISDANSDNTIGWVSVATTDYQDVGGNKQASVKNLNIPIPTKGTGLYMYGVVGASATPTYTAATDLVITVYCHVYS